MCCALGLFAACVNDPTIATDLAAGGAVDGASDALTDGADLAVDLGQAVDLAIDLLPEVDQSIPGDLLAPYDAALATPTFVADNQGLSGGAIRGLGARSSTHLVAISRYDYFESTSAGIAWQRGAQQPPPLVDDEWSALAVDPTLDTVAIGSQSGRVFVLGATGGFVDLGTVGVAVPIVGLAFWQGVLYAATQRGLFVAGPSSWTLVEDTGTAQRWNVALYASPDSSLDPDLWLARNDGLYRLTLAVPTPTLRHAATVDEVQFETQAGLGLHALYLSKPDQITLYTNKTDQATPCTPAGTPILSFGYATTLILRTATEYQRGSTCPSPSFSMINGDITSAIARFVANGNAQLGFGTKGVYATNSSVAELDEGIDAVSIRALAAPYDNPRILFAASSSGAWRHANGAWSRLATPNGAYAAYTDVVVSRADSTRMALLTEELDQPGLLVSTDGGQAFVPTTQPGQFSAIAYDQVNPDRVLGCNGGGIRISFNAGVDWQIQKPDGGAPGLENCRLLVAHPTLAGVFFASDGQGRIYRTDDGALTWSELAPGSLKGVVVRQLVPGGLADVRAVIEGLGIIDIGAAKIGTVFAPTAVVRSLSIDPLVPERSFAIVGDSIYEAKPSGPFAELANALSARAPRVVLVHPADRRQVWIGTDDRGAFRGDAMPLP